MKRLSLIIGLLLLMMTLPVWAQAPITVQQESITSEFRNNITAKIYATGPAEITEVEFFYRVAGKPATTRAAAQFSPGTTVDASFTINQTATYFPPGTELEYWWKLTDVNGETLKTDRQSYRYMDERYDFQSLSNERVSLYWYRGGDSFGQTLFDQANVALDRLENTVGVTVEKQVSIFIYGSHEDLLNAIAVGAQEWTGGQAFGEFGVVVLGITPGNLSWGLKATTHELTHLVINQATDNPYGDLPRWLDEGLAVYNEDPDRLDSQFRVSFDDAVRNNTLMSLQTLSSSFPADPQKANLAYGESGAVVKFIIDTYGGDAMNQLLQIFSEGELYDKALMQALGVDMHGLDNAWRASLGLPPLPGSESDAPQNQPADAVVAPTATPASESVVAPTPAPSTAAEQTQETAPSSLMRVLLGLAICALFAGALIVGIIVLVVILRRKK